MGEFRLDEVMKLVLEEHVYLVLLREDVGPEWFEKMKPFLDKAIQLETVVCNLMGVDGNDVIEALKRNEFSVEESCRDLVKLVEKRLEEKEKTQD